MKRVLIVSPSFPPTSAADMHRVRTSLAFYREFGWEPHVLAIDPAAHGGLEERELLQTIPADIPITRCGAVAESLTRWAGIHTPALRALGHLFRSGAAIIRRDAIDLTYFSTTMFPVATLGRVWKARFGTPFIVDFQDPWKTDYRGRGVVRGPKASAARFLNARMEPFAMRKVDGITSVSAAYSDSLLKRYPWLRPEMCATIPFGASREDIDAAHRLAWRNQFFDRRDGNVHGVSVGRGGKDLEAAAELLFAGASKYQTSGSSQSIRLTFVGTDYANHNGRKSLAPAAARLGLETVSEHPARVPYLHALRLLADAHFTVILGSDDASYSPSKVYPYLLTGRPFLAVIHHASPVVPVLQRSEAGVVITFGAGENREAVVQRIVEGLASVTKRGDAPVQVVESLIESLSARALTRLQCGAFDAALRHGSPQGIPCVE